MEKQLTYNYSAEEITRRCRTIIKLAKEDIKYFEKFGLNIKDFDQLAQQVSVYESFPEDSIFAKKVSEKTKKKSDDEQTLKVEIRNMLLHISVLFSTKEDMKKYFKSQKITGIPASELIEFGEKVYKTANTLKAKLIASGMVQEDFDNFKQTIKALKVSLKDLEVVRQERLQKTDKRRELGKSLYEKLVKYSTIGKNIWKQRDTERYQSYLLYKSYYEKIKAKRDEVLKNERFDDDF